MNIKKLLCALSLLTVQSNFCMENQERQERESRVEVLDDGHAWSIIENMEDVRPFAEKIVACRSPLGGLGPYKDPDSGTRYVLISGEHGSFDHPCFTACAGDEGYHLGRMYYDSERGDWSEGPIAIVRLLTRKEISRLSSLINDKKLYSYDQKTPRLLRLGMNGHHTWADVSKSL